MHVQQKSRVIHTGERSQLVVSAPCRARVLLLPAGPGALPPAPRVLDMMRDRSSGEAGDYDQ
jgi:hypothetical protein